MCLAAALYAEGGEELTVKVALIGADSTPAYFFGRLALVIEGGADGNALYYDYGNAAVSGKGYFSSLAFGRITCEGRVMDAGAAYREHAACNRSVTLYTLNLPGEAKRSIDEAAKQSVTEERRRYPYHFFRNNGTQRVTDIVDAGLLGAFYAALENSPARLTAREHIRRYTYRYPLVDWGVNFMLGQSVDRKTSAKGELFLSAEAAARLSSFYYTNEDGESVPLVNNIESIYEAAGRAATPDKAPKQYARYGGLGAALSALAAFAVVMRRRGAGTRGRRIFYGLFAALGLLLGAAGCTLCFAMFFTRHDYTFNNINFLFANPALLALLPLGLLALFAKKPIVRRYAELFTGSLLRAVFLCGVLTVVVRLFPAYYQDNTAILLTVMPAFIVGVVYRLSVIG